MRTHNIWSVTLSRYQRLEAQHYARCNFHTMLYPILLLRGVKLLSSTAALPERTRWTCQTTLTRGVLQGLTACKRLGAFTSPAAC